jgi:hypothetical protein
MEMNLNAQRCSPINPHVSNGAFCGFDRRIKEHSIRGYFVLWNVHNHRSVVLASKRSLCSRFSNPHIRWSNCNTLSRSNNADNTQGEHEIT